MMLRLPGANITFVHETIRIYNEYVPLTNSPVFYAYCLPMQAKLLETAFKFVRFLSNQSCHPNIATKHCDHYTVHLSSSITGMCPRHCMGPNSITYIQIIHPVENTVFLLLHLPVTTQFMYY